MLQWIIYLSYYTSLLNKLNKSLTVTLVPIYAMEPEITEATVTNTTVVKIFILHLHKIRFPLDSHLYYIIKKKTKMNPVGRLSYGVAATAAAPAV